MKKRLHKIKKMVGMVVLVSMLGSVPFSVQAAQVNTIGAEYIVPDVTSELYTESEIAGMSAKELCYARNEIFARHGRTFKSNELQTYFNGKSWYNAQYEPDYFDEISKSIVSETEQKNAALFLKQEESLGKYVLDSSGSIQASTSNSETSDDMEQDLIDQYMTLLQQNYFAKEIYNEEVPAKGYYLNDFNNDQTIDLFIYGESTDQNVWWEIYTIDENGNLTKLQENYDEYYGNAGHSVGITSDGTIYVGAYKGLVGYNVDWKTWTYCEGQTLHTFHYEYYEEMGDINLRDENGDVVVTNVEETYNLDGEELSIEQGRELMSKMPEDITALNVLCTSMS